nr:ATP-binding cassette domain-containing protein [Corynebacterium deserti]
MHCFLGPNGAGKSTTLRTLIGVLTPKSGSMSVLGHNPVTNSEILRHVGYDPADVAL